MPDVAISPADALTRMAFGFRGTQALYVVAKLGMADYLVEGPVVTDKLARKVGVKPMPLLV